MTILRYWRRARVRPAQPGRALPRHQFAPAPGTRIRGCSWSAESRLLHGAGRALL